MIDRKTLFVAIDKCPLCGKDGKESFNMFLCTNFHCDNYDRKIMSEIRRDKLKKRKELRKKGKEKAIEKEVSTSEEYYYNYGWNSMSNPDMYFPFYTESDNNEA